MHECNVDSMYSKYITQQYTNLTGEWFLAAVQAHVCLQVAGAGEALAAGAALMRLLPSVNQVVLLQVRQLRE